MVEHRSPKPGVAGSSPAAPAIINFMKKLFNLSRNSDRAWLIIWTLIFVNFLGLDAFFPNSIPVTLLKITGILLCVVYSFIKFRKDYYLIAAMFFTLVADVILAVNNVSVFGVGVFCLVLMTHAFRMSSIKPHVFNISVIAAIFVFAISMLLGQNPLYVMVGIYGLGLFFNVFQSGIWFFFKRTPASKCAFIGFLLFLACDLCVGVSFAANIGAFPSFLQGIMSFLAWGFYYPSQILISNSTTV